MYYIPSVVLGLRSHVLSVVSLGVSNDLYVSVGTTIRVRSMYVDVHQTPIKGPVLGPQTVFKEPLGNMLVTMYFCIVSITIANCLKFSGNKHIIYT